MAKLVKTIYKRIIRFMQQPINGGYIPVDDNGFWKVRYPPTVSLNKTAELFNEIRGKP